MVQQPATQTRFGIFLEIFSSLFFFFFAPSGVLCYEKISKKALILALRQTMHCPAKMDFFSLFLAHCVREGAEVERKKKCKLFLYTS